tara:strand:+ start:223 stop:351 length:129 start_codon:yes stop_codon:yes gene_type:complete
MVKQDMVLGVVVKDLIFIMNRIMQSWVEAAVLVRMDKVDMVV